MSASSDASIAKYNQLRQQQSELVGQKHETEASKREYSLALETLEQVDGSRRCFQMIGGVLIEKKVEDVRPKLAETINLMDQVIDQCDNRLEQNIKDLEQHKLQYKVAPESPSAAGDASKGKSASKSGVLVE